MSNLYQWEYKTHKGKIQEKGSVRKSFCHILSYSGKKTVKSLSLRYLVSYSVNTDYHNAIHKCSSFNRCDKRPYLASGKATQSDRITYYTHIQYILRLMWTYMCQTDPTYHRQWTILPEPSILQSSLHFTVFICVF